MADNGTGWNSPKIAPVGTALEWQLELRVPQILAMMETCKKMPCIRRPLLDKIVKLALGSDLAYNDRDRYRSGCGAGLMAEQSTTVRGRSRSGSIGIGIDRGAGVDRARARE